LKPLPPRKDPPAEQLLALPAKETDTTYFVRDSDYFGQTVQHGALSTYQASHIPKDSDRLSEQSNIRPYIEYP
jgi:hypothetical protein